MGKFCQFILCAAIVGAASGQSHAQDIGPLPANQFYAHLDGGYVIGEQGSGIVDFGASDVHPGDGSWFSGQFGKMTSTDWDWRVGAGFASLDSGRSNGAADNNEYGIDGATMFNLDTEMGWMTNIDGLHLRPFAGVRYLQWKQDQGYRPDFPLGCCFMDSKFWGIGPHIGINAALPVSQLFAFVAGADASILFGRIEFNRGTTGLQVPPATGDDNRSVLGFGGYIGFNMTVTENVSLGARYRILYLDGSSYDDQGFSNPAGPSGKASNVLQGPSASFTIGF